MTGDHEHGCHCEHHHEPHHEHHHEQHCGCGHEHHCDCHDEHHCRCRHDHDHDGGGGGHEGGGGHGSGGHGGGHGGGGNPNRPGKTVGTSRGRLPSDKGLDGDDINGDHPKGSWAGQRKDLYLPYLFMRANAGDTGTRPVVGAFWESPDVLIMAGVAPADAPPVPPELGQTALAGAPNTVYAHVWNFGQSSAPQTVVEFYWCDPSLGIGPQSAHLIGQTVVALGHKGSGQSHALVKCPEAWTPTFLNGGHECLLVRAWDYTSDALGTPAWDASLNRHIGQRNIHVIDSMHAMMLAGQPGQPGQLGAALAGAGIGAAGIAGAEFAGAAAPGGPALSSPLLLKVGPLFGAPADVTVERVVPSAVPWLQLRTGRGQFPVQATPTGTIALSRPGATGGGLPTGGAGTAQKVTGDDQHVAFTTTDAHPPAGEAHVYRVRASQQGQVFGGYTIVILG